MRRRDFLVGMMGLAASCRAGTPSSRATGSMPAPARSPSALRFGYAAITWGGDDLRAIDEIAEAGFPGVQLRASAVERWGSRPDEAKALLADRGLTFVALSSGVVRLDPRHEADDLALHVRHARFLRDAGGLYLQVLDERPRDRAPVADDYRRMGRLLTELGRRTADLGIPLGYHNHMGSLGQAPEEVERIFDAADPRYVKLLLDIAHWTQAGGDPAAAVRTYADRLLLFHVKDVQSPVPGRSADSYRFVELGEGTVDLDGFFRAVRDVAFRGWAIVELDAPVPPERAPKQTAVNARRVLEQRFGLRVGDA